MALGRGVRRAVCVACGGLCVACGVWRMTCGVRRAAAQDDDKQMRAHANMAIVHKMRRELPHAIKHLDQAVALAVRAARPSPDARR